MDENIKASPPESFTDSTKSTYFFLVFTSEFLDKCLFKCQSLHLPLKYTEVELRLVFHSITEPEKLIRDEKCLDCHSFMSNFYMFWSIACPSWILDYIKQKNLKSLWNTLKTDENRSVYCKRTSHLKAWWRNRWELWPARGKFTSSTWMIRVQFKSTTMQ